MDSLKPTQQQMTIARKRLPIFEFLSDADLKQVLCFSSPSEANSFGLFPKIATFSTVVVDPETESIIGVKNCAGKAGEEMIFLKPINTKGRHPLDWICDVIATVPVEMRAQFLAAWEGMQNLKGERNKSRGYNSQELSEFPEPIVLLLLRVKFTQDVDAALRSGKLQSLQSLDKCLMQRIFQISMTVRDQAKKISRKGSSIITLLFGQVRQLRKLIKYAKISTYVATWEFWRSQLRYYVKASGNAANIEEKYNSKENSITKTILSVRCGESVEIPYGFQYGSHRMLVQTDLTHEAYATAMSAFEAGKNRLVVVNGPVGTGKIEVLKDLANALGINCYLYKHCSSRKSDHSALILAVSRNPNMMFLFEGLDKEGAEVIQAITSANDEKDIATRTGLICVVGNLDKKEVKESLGSLPACATQMMTTPDLVRIYEVMLAIEGFTTPETVAVELNNFLVKARETFSEKSWYDYGLRTAKVLIKTAGAFLRSSRSIKDEAEAKKERKGLHDALCASILPSLVPADLTLASGQLHAQFPTFPPFPSNKNDTRGVEELMSMLSKSDAKKMTKLKGDVGTKFSMIQFSVMSKIRHGLLALSDSPKYLLHALSTLASLVGVNFSLINHDNLTTAELYGAMTEDGEWQRGVLAERMMSAANKDGAPTWIVLEGKMDQVKLQPLYSILDDNRKLFQENGSVVSLPKNANVVLISTPDEVAKWKPAAISRVGVVHFIDNESGRCSVM
mmetsp:Transcript_1625/g.2021  ORF Transcript_1625/g.2021 Transcript_1625/m.2021 type:complete len:735 (-) Transcript_1625:129-2333(-)|eukprot:jgi/Bigna1/91721/estExt_fgenesh1_pg.C_1150007